MICLLLFQQISIHCLYAIAVMKMMFLNMFMVAVVTCNCARVVEDKQSYSCVFIWLRLPLTWGRLAQ